MGVYIYGAYQDGTKQSRVCTDVNIGDLLTYKAISGYLSGHSIECEPLLPDESLKIGALREGDVLIVGGGGLLHPGLINSKAIEASKARLIVFGLGINWSIFTSQTQLRSIQAVASCLERADLVVVRDHRTKAFLRCDRALISPDVTWSLFDSKVQPGESSAVVLGGNIAPQDGETKLSFNLVHNSKADLIVKEKQDLVPFKRIRTTAYHGLMLGLANRSEVLCYSRNVKHEAFYESYWDRISVEEHGPFYKVQTVQQEWFRDQSVAALELLAKTV